MNVCPIRVKMAQHVLMGSTNTLVSGLSSLVVKQVQYTTQTKRTVVAANVNMHASNFLPI